MYIHFDKNEMGRVKETYAKWWNGTIDRPVISMRRYKAYSAVNTATAPVLEQSNCHDFSYSPKQLIEAWDCSMSGLRFEADGFPFVNFSCFGPGVLAAMVGGVLDNSSGAVWFYPGEKTELKDIHPHYDPENKWTKRIKDIYYAGLEYWNGAVIMGMPDLGGVLDVAAALRGTENLLYDLYDEPEEVLRLVGEIETAWHEAYNDFASVLAPQEAFTDWSGILCPEKSYIVQSDFCYMISNPMFREFVLPTLKRDVAKLPNVIYHLDGPGELKHLDDILAIPELKAVQWIPGASNPPTSEYPEVYEKIVSAGKRYWICGDDNDFYNIYSKAGGQPFYSCGYRADNNEPAEKMKSFI